MPIYMDIHHVPGIEAIDLAEAHRKDMLIQTQYQCKCMTYWVDVDRGVAFCLIEAPDKSTVEKCTEISRTGTQQNYRGKKRIGRVFLGRIHDPKMRPSPATG